MHSEHLRNLHPGWVVGGWLVAIAVTSVVYLALVGTGLLPLADSDVLGVTVAVAVGFFTGGFFVGVRWTNAPVLHGAAITLFGVLVWFVGALTLPGRVSILRESAPAVLGLILVQLVASVAGGWSGMRRVMGGADEASES
jgi:hypothetical protein